MDIHRCRFVPYPPSTINSLAFSHSYVAKSQKAASPRLAVGRANGDIEIWNPLKGAWLQETVIHGGQDRSIDGLVWIQDPSEEVSEGRTIIGKSRLFSIGYTTTVTEWDLENGRPLRQTSGNHGEIWCLAAQPALAPGETDATGWEGQYLVTGCTDGALVLYSTADDDLQLKRVLVRPSSKKAKIISITFQDRNFVVAGCTDSTIRVYDIRTGTMVRSMSLGVGPSGGPKEIIVWTVKVLAGGNIISGDSTGELRIWSGKTYSLIQRIKGHRQDILSLATSHDGKAIFSGGMDRRTVVYKHVGGAKSRWAEVGHRRYHDHDVKTMATLEAKGISVVVSGGPDASPMVLPLQQFGMENQRALPYLSQEPALKSSSKKRLLMSWWDREVDIWRLTKPKSTDATEQGDEPTAQNRKLISKILIKGEANISSAALSSDGNLLAVATAEEIKMFQLRVRRSDDGESLKVVKIALPLAFSRGARLVEFSSDGKWLCIVRDNSRIVVARIISDGKGTASSIRVLASTSRLERINRQIEKHVLLGGLGSYERSITRAVFSSDSRILAVSDLAGYIDTWVLSGNEDTTESLLETSEEEDDESSSDSSSESEDEDGEDAKPKLVFGQHWARNPVASQLPKLPSTPIILTFRPSTASSTVELPNPPATRTTPHPISHSLPHGEDRLVVVTASNKIYEFSVLGGSLTPWSRRNTPQSFPIDFQQLRDQARGCIWDVSPLGSDKGRERLWIYGINFLFLFDLSVDFPPHAALAEAVEDEEQPGPVNSKKRKLNPSIKLGKQQHSGAGSSIPSGHMSIGPVVARVTHEDDETISQPYLLHSHATESNSDSDSESEYAGNAVALLKERAEADEDEERKENWWFTFKYRPILGLAQIGESSGETGPEVALVERPIWEADLPPRYYGDQEWAKEDY
ncbi:U3 small nucleolar RNA-associated protein [Phlyctema vagabunda]|uniref:U3 small nucleolar RNA-associated protein n=1 Tax=Phlyctema vagabunda TaxID=108571 RepID=A0ABR4P469_9HELO